MDDLVQFLRARLDNDERIAREADEGPWQLKTLGRHDQAAVSTEGPGALVQLDGVRATANGAHIAHHDPARVLREIQAHRTTVDEYDIALGVPAATDQAAYWKGHVETLREVCLRLATVHADHPDYQAAWGP